MPLPRAVPAAVALAVTLFTAACAPPPPPPSPPVDPDVATGRWTWTPQPGPLDLGVTHTRHSLDAHGPDDARARGTAILDGGAVWQNHHLMGFGTLNPQPSPDDLD